MTNHSRVPSSLYEITSDRIASSLARPPALRMTCASPSLSPANFAGSRRASMHVRIAKRRAGGSASDALAPKSEAYRVFALRTSCRTVLMLIPLSPSRPMTNGLAVHHVTDADGKRQQGEKRLVVE